MKTAEEYVLQWRQEVEKGFNFESDGPEFRKFEADFYRQIQLDAMKEGARRAATVVVENNQPVFDLPTRLHTRQALGQAILAAAEQLTEKDL